MAAADKVRFCVGGSGVLVVYVLCPGWGSGELYQRRKCNVAKPRMPHLTTGTKTEIKVEEAVGHYVFGII